MNKNKFLVVYVALLSFISTNFAFSQSDITNKILQQIETNPSPRESLVQWYYSMDDFYAKIAGLS
jgi:hypothetical protein